MLSGKTSFGCAADGLPPGPLDDYIDSLRAAGADPAKIKAAMDGAGQAKGKPSVSAPRGANTDGKDNRVFDLPTYDSPSAPQYHPRIVPGS